MSRIEELERKLAESRAARGKGEEAQYEVDLEARISLEEEHGTTVAVKVVVFTPGQPTMALLRMPNAAEYKRYKDLVYRAQLDPHAKTSAKTAQEQLAKSCWVYPTTEEARASMLGAFPGLLTPLGSAASALAEGKTEEAGKD